MITTTRPAYRIALEQQSYKNMLYLLLSFPFGLGYFVALVTGIAVGLGTLIIWIGVPILIAMIIAWWYTAVFERRMAIYWLHVSIAPMGSLLGSLSSGSLQWWQKLPGYLSNRMVWKTLLYLLLKFPFGLISFILVVVLSVLSIALTLVALVIYAITTPFVALVLAMRRAPRPGRALQRYFLLAATAFGLSLASLHVFNGLAFLAAQQARQLLGMSETALNLYAARAQAEQERLRAEQAERRRRELVVNVSHELRAPVASISGHLESLLLATREGTATPPAPTLYNYLAIAHQETLRLGLLVDELLSLARMEAGELRLDIQAIAAGEVIEEVYQTLMPLAQRERQVTLVRGVALNLPSVQADRQRLKQVLLNLVRNAITSTPAGGIVSITLEAANAQQVALVVEDNGIGIAEEELQRIFERFYRTDASRSRSSGGFGLGLTIVHDLVTAMGGTITVKSTVGQGTSFCVLLRSATSTHPLSTNSPI